MPCHGNHKIWLVIRGNKRGKGKKMGKEQLATLFETTAKVRDNVGHKQQKFHLLLACRCIAIHSQVTASPAGISKAALCSAFCLLSRKNCSYGARLFYMIIKLLIISQCLCINYM